MATLDSVFCIAIVFLLIGIGCFKSRSIHSESSYLFAERKTGWAALTATLVMTEFNSATLISFASLGYAAGLWALSLPLIFLIGLLFYAVTVAEKWKEYNGASVASFFSNLYGNNIGRLTSLLLLLSMIGFSGAYIKSLTLLFQPLFAEMSPWLLSGILFLLILVMNLRGGLIAIIRTDMISFLLVIAFFPILALFMWKSSGLPPVMDRSQFSAGSVLPLRFVLSLTILTMFTYILAPWYGQKIFSAKSKKTAYWSVLSAAVIVFLLYGCAIIATAFFRFRGYCCPTGEQAFPSLINLCLPEGVKGVAYALLFATSATTLTGIWNAMSAMWITDFIKKEESSYLRSMRITLYCALCSYFVANVFVDKVFDKIILANIPVAALSFGLLGGFYWKRASQGGVVLSILVGCVCGVGSYWIYGEAGGYTWYWAIYGIPLIFIAGMVGSILYPKRPSLN